VDDELIHIDFLQLSEGKAVVVDIPVKFVGTSKGVRAGGKLIPRLRKLKVSALPSAMRPYLEVNVDDLDLGKHIRVRDLNFDGISIVTAAANPIVSALVTRQLKQAEAEAKAKK
jgi:large subunit ribosomal protein L25